MTLQRPFYRNYRHLRIVATALLIWLLAGSGVAVAAAPAEPHRVDSGDGTILIISSYNPDTKRMMSFISEFSETLQQKQVPYEVVLEDMGCKGLDEASIWSERLNAVRSRYMGKDLKAIILLGQEAWASFLSLGAYPRDIPFFGCYVSENGITLADDSIGQPDWYPESLDMHAWADTVGTAGGVLNRYYVRENIDLICSLYPEVRNIGFVSDNTYGGISLQALVRKEMAAYCPDLNLILIDGRQDGQAVAHTLAGLPQNTALLIGTWRVGQDGQYLITHAIETLVADNGTLPVFSLSGSGIGEGAIGGYIPKYVSGAKEIAGQIIERIGNPNYQIHFEHTSAEYTFDRKQLTKYGLADYKLPTGSVIIDSLELKVQEYEYYILIGGSALIVLGLMFVGLGFLYYRNRKLKLALEYREEALIEAREQAEETSRLKSAFIANMSHEIRTPLNAIVGFSSLLGEESLSSEEREEFKGLIAHNSEMLLTLFNDILDVSSLESGKMRFDYKDTEVCQLCQSVIVSTAHTRQEGVECIFVSAYSSYYLNTDAQRLAQVLVNLLTNAGKFTERGRITLELDVQTDRNRVLFAVSDTGCGIAKEQQDKVFDRFEKLNKFRQGTGLGLAICRQIVEHFGGEIWIDSQYTAGTRFVFFMPVLHELHQSE